MASGPLVFIHPLIEENMSSSIKASNGNGAPPGGGGGGGVIGDDYFYWANPMSGTKTDFTTASTVTSRELFADEFLTADWNNIRLQSGHSDPNIRFVYTYSKD